MRDPTSEREDDWKIHLNALYQGLFQKKELARTDSIYSAIKRILNSVKIRPNKQVFSAVANGQ
ncbi:MAG: hypothetical protein Fur006_39200 [Coleofasciculaceae cyanobacterium]